MFPRSPLIRRLLAVWISLSILGFGMAVAADAHPPMADQAPFVGEPSHDGGQADPGAGCGDCCGHAAAHLLGLTAAEAFPPLPFSGVFRARFSPAATAHTPEALLRPPIRA